MVLLLIVTGGRPQALFEHGPYTSDFMDAQAHALVAGHLSVDPGVATIEGFVHRGHTYLYFGLAPAILRLPVAAVTDNLDGRLTALSILAALAVAMWASGRLLWRARLVIRGDGELRDREALVAGAFVAAVGLSSPLMYLTADTLVYHEAIAWGVGLGLVTIDRALAWWAEPSGRNLVLASAAATGAVNARPSVGLGAAVVLLLMVGVRILRRDERRPRIVAVLLLAVLAPIAIAGAVNAARFGTPGGPPFKDQVLSHYDRSRIAALAANDGTIVGPQFAPTALVDYLRVDGVRIQRLFPWITYRESTAIVGDVTFDVVDRAGSLPAVAPALVVLALVGFLALARRPGSRPWWLAVAGTVVGWCRR